MGETFWHMRRSQRMRDGLALKSIQWKVQGPARGTPEKRKKITSEAGMCIKTNKTKTKCLGKVGHLRLTDTNFAEKSGFVTTICRLSSLFKDLFRAELNSLRDCLSVASCGGEVYIIGRLGSENENLWRFHDSIPTTAWPARVRHPGSYPDSTPIHPRG